MPITIAVTARNEEASLAACLTTLVASVAQAEARTTERYRVVVVLDECTDRSMAVAQSFRRVMPLVSRGGKLEAQRSALAAFPPGDELTIFCDADILINLESIQSLTQTMRADPALRVAYAGKRPIALDTEAARHLIARVLFSYNRHGGFQAARKYFSGPLFAIRDWRAPRLEELPRALVASSLNRLYRFDLGVLIDDIYLSRDILQRHGPDAISAAPEALVHFVAPSTLRGMYLTYRRMRWGIERVHHIAPESVATHVLHGVRGRDPQAWAAASRRDRTYWYVFQLLLRGCALAYGLERWRTLRSARPFEPWPAIREAKLPARP